MIGTTCSRVTGPWAGSRPSRSRSARLRSRSWSPRVPERHRPPRRGQVGTVDSGGGDEDVVRVSGGATGLRAPSSVRAQRMSGGLAPVRRCRPFQAGTVGGSAAPSISRLARAIAAHSRTVEPLLLRRAIRSGLSTELALACIRWRPRVLEPVDAYPGRLPLHPHAQSRGALNDESNGRIAARDYRRRASPPDVSQSRTIYGPAAGLLDGADDRGGFDVLGVDEGADAVRV